MHSIPSKRVRTSGYCFGSVENLSVAFFETYRLTFDLRKIAPVKYSPAGTTTRPPPALLHASIAVAIADVESLATPVFAPNLAISKSRLGKTGGFIRESICG